MNVRCSDTQDLPSRCLRIDFASLGKSVGDGERQRAVSMRNRRNFLQVESNDFC
jgi:hypothetical protein